MLCSLDLGYIHNNKEYLHEKCQAGVTISLVYKLQITYFNNIMTKIHIRSQS